MIDPAKLRAALEQALADVEGAFVVDLTVSPADDIEATVDSTATGGIDLDTCAELSRRLQAAIEAEDPEADYSLELGTAGLTAPFRVHGQWVKNEGHEVEATLADGRRLHGTLRHVESGPDGSTQAVIAVAGRTREPGRKKPVDTVVEHPVDSRTVRSIHAEIKF